MNCALFAFSAIGDANKNLIALYLRLSQLIATRTATRDLTGLVEKELLVRQGEKKGTHYLLSPAISEKIRDIKGQLQPSGMLFTDDLATYPGGQCMGLPPSRWKCI